MLIKTTFRILTLAALFSVTAATMASARIVPWNLPSCYLAIHDDCYGNGKEGCTEEEYNTGLDWCHDVKWETIPKASLGKLKIGGKTLHFKNGKLSVGK